jgi:hypothetical protein
MPSVLDGLTDNATLTFLQGDGTVTFDDDKNPVEGSAPPLVVKAMVKKDRNATNRHDRPPGIDWAQSIPVKGKLIDPAIIGPTLQSPAITRLKLLKLVGEKFTGWMVFDP